MTAEPKRLGKRMAQKVVDAFLRAMLGEVPFTQLVADGQRSWAFWVCDGDTTSYVHCDGRIEWYGTSYPEGYNT